MLNMILGTKRQKSQNPISFFYKSLISKIHIVEVKKQGNNNTPCNSPNQILPTGDGSICFHFSYYLFPSSFNFKRKLHCELNNESQAGYIILPTIRNYPRWTKTRANKDRGYLTPKVTKCRHN